MNLVRKILFLVLMLAYAFYLIFLLIHSIKLEGAGLSTLNGVFWFITFISFVVTMAAIGKKFIRKEKVGFVQSYFVFIFCFTVLMSITTTFYYFKFAQKHQFYVSRNQFNQCIETYNTTKTGNQFNGDLFMSIAKATEKSAGIFILDIDKYGVIFQRDFNFYFLKENKTNKRPAERPEDIKYLILVEPQIAENIGTYTDNAKGFRESINIKVFMYNNSLTRLFETSVKGSEPQFSKTDHNDKYGGGVPGSNVDDAITNIISQLPAQNGVK